MSLGGALSVPALVVTVVCFSFFATLGGYQNSRLRLFDSGVRMAPLFEPPSDAGVETPNHTTLRNGF